MSRLAPVLAVAVFVGTASPAEAYFCTRATSDQSSPTQVWMSRCIPYRISTAGSNLDSEERRQLVQQSFAVWSSLPCTDLEFRDRGRTDETDAFDVNKPEETLNVIASIEAESDSFPDPRLLAITLTRFSVRTGEILDADILLNGVGFRFDEVTDPVSCMAQERSFDLRNTLVHEIGHFIGFDHSPIAEATMFAQADPCEIEKRDLAEDDQMGVCNVYPKGLPTKTCTPPASYTPSDALDPTPFRDQCSRPDLPDPPPGGCSCSTSDAHAPPGWFVLAMLILAVRVAASGPRALRARRAER